jgi:hypothetical protein
VNALQNVQFSAMSASCYLADHEFGPRRAIRDAFGLYFLVLAPNFFKLTAHVSDIVGSVQLHEESVGITELERFLRPAWLRCQITRFQFGRRLNCVKAGDSEVVVIEGRPTVLLFDSEKTLPYALKTARARRMTTDIPILVLSDLKYHPFFCRDPRPWLLERLTDSTMQILIASCARGENARRSSNPHGFALGLGLSVFGLTGVIAVNAYLLNYFGLPHSLW